MNNIECSYLQLNPRVDQQEQPTYDIGVEITIPGLQNDLDHHGELDTVNTPSACEQALALTNLDILAIAKREQLATLLGEEGLTLATVRPDADSLTAMAVIASKLQGRPINTDLVRSIGILDRKGPRYMEGNSKDLVIAIARNSADFKKSLAERVQFIQSCLEGQNDETLVAELVEARNKEFEEARENSVVQEIIPGKLVYVESTCRFATSLGYELADTVVACNPAMKVMDRDPESGRFVPTGDTYRKYTICKRDENVSSDLSSVLAELVEREKGWGGRPSAIIGSPQNTSSTLSTEEVLEIVSRYL